MDQSLAAGLLVPRRHPVDQPELLAHLGEEPPAHAAAEHADEHLLDGELGVVLGQAGEAERDVLLLELLGDVRALRGELEIGRVAALGGGAAQAGEAFFYVRGEAFGVERAGRSDLEASGVVERLPVGAYGVGRDARERVELAAGVPAVDRSERGLGDVHAQQVVGIVVEVLALFEGELDGDAAGLVGEGRLREHLGDEVDDVEGELGQGERPHHHRLASAGAAPLGAEQVEGVGQGAAVAHLRTLGQRAFDDHADAVEVGGFVGHARQHAKDDRGDVALREGIDGQLDAAGELRVKERLVVGACLGDGHQCSTGRPSIGVSSASFSVSSCGSEASMFRRITGSVLDGRRLNHQFGYCTVTPSSRSISPSA